MRINQKDLEIQVASLNEMAGFENPEYSTIGSYDLSYAYGGVALHMYVNNSGAVRDVLRSGHVPKKTLYNLINAYKTGLSQ